MNNGDDLQIGGSSLVSLEGLTKPATVLIEKISDAVGALYRPRQIVREARAEAESEKIKAIAGIEISEIQRRGALRFFEQQGRWQENFESIVSQALPEVTEEAKPEEMDSDWLERFFESSKMVSDKQMQTLWARLLAGEANHKGTFTKRTIEQVTNLEKSDAELFTRLCGFSLEFDGLTPLVYELEDSIYSEHGLTFIDLTHLDSIGLIKFERLAGYILTTLDKVLAPNYFGVPICVEVPNPDTQFRVGSVILTRIGKELGPISGSGPIPHFLDYVVGKWREFGYAPYSPLPEGKPKVGSVINK